MDNEYTEAGSLYQLALDIQLLNVYMAHLVVYTYLVCTG